jgi:glucosamine--fructose-6-phosphate aminotransferase (isomerizing)
VVQLCGIVGCLLSEGRVAPLIHEALKHLEYRGYDSVGEATIHEGRLHVRKDQGKVDEVDAKLDLKGLPGRVGIGHTRWATHGAPTQSNAHPHIDCDGTVAVAHNGIIENFSALRAELEDRGHVFRSKTDTEVIPHLIEEFMKSGLSFADAVHESVKRLDGSYAIAAICTREPDRIVCARKESPLVIGVGDNAIYCASDIPAFLPWTNRVVTLQDGEIAVLSEAGFEIKNIADGSAAERAPEVVDWTVEMAEKRGYPHFMLKEIHEQPEALRNTLRVQELYLDLMTTFIDRAREVYLVACGTSYHACVAAAHMFSKLAFRSAQPVIASEFVQQCGDSIGIDSTVWAVSQSGETADVLAAVMHASKRAATVLGLTNVIGSTLTRVSRAYICQQSGPEIGVAATKTYTSQLLAMAEIAIRLAEKRGKLAIQEVKNLRKKLREIPDVVQQVIDRQEDKIKNLARKYRDKNCFFFLGRGMSTSTAAEGRLKLLEVAYVHATAYPAGESKHGPISLIEKGFPVVFVCPNDSTRKEIVGNIMEVKARGATIIAVIEEGDEEIKKLADDYVEVPRGVPEVLTPIPFVVPLQLFAYYMAVERGYDPDMPRNLAKSVTVR